MSDLHLRRCRFHCLPRHVPLDIFVHLSVSRRRTGPSQSPLHARFPIRFLLNGGTKESMASSASPLRSLIRNLGMATTGITVLITSLASLEIFVFLERARLPLFVLTAVAWGGYYIVTTLINPLKSGKLIISAEGPGEEIVQKATYFSFQQQEEFAEGSKADEAFVRAEQAYLAYQYSRAVTNYQESLAAKASVPAYVNAAISLLNSSLFEQAEELLGMGLALAERLELRPSQAACHANISIIHARTGRWDSAVEACVQASGLFRQLGDGRGRADVQLTLGNIQANRGDWEAALFRVGPQTIRDCPQ